MINFPKPVKYKRFKNYLRQCCICGDVFNAISKHGVRPRTKLCDKCKGDINTKRLKTIMETKLKLKEVRNELTKLGSATKPCN